MNVAEFQFHPPLGVEVLRLERPPANALNVSMVESLIEFIDRARASASSLLIKSEVPRFFCAGGDISEYGDLDEAQLSDRLRTFHRLMLALQSFPGSVACQVDGYAVGAGCELLFYGDLVIATPESKFGFPEVRNGVLPAAKGIKDLIRRVGDAVAREMLIGGELISAERAAAVGLIHQVVDRAELDEVAGSWAHDVSQRPRELVRALRFQIEDVPSRTDDELIKLSVDLMLRANQDPEVVAGRKRWVSK